MNLCALRGFFVVVLMIALFTGSSAAQHLGFDRNDYPGDANLPALRQTFSYIGYWISNPPGETSNSWVGKKQTVESAGFGFLVLFNGRLDAQLKRNAAGLGRSDGQSAVTAARRESFPARTVIFLDLEEGGRMSAQQKAYIYAWVDTVNASGFRAGVYCSGIPVTSDEDIITADDIRATARGRDITYWVVQDSCPPSPGCRFPNQPASPGISGISYAEIWQFVRSPKQPESAGKCGGYNAQDGNCYPPGIDPGAHVHIDVNTATSADPSHGR